MIIMVNGAFGVGKTTIAQGLLSEIPNSMLYDPEEIGLMLRKFTQGVRQGSPEPRPGCGR